MLAVVDTNHLSELERDAGLPLRFEERRRAVGFEVFTTIITVQEITKGWLALLNRKAKPAHQVVNYGRFQRSYEALCDWDILSLRRRGGCQINRAGKAAAEHRYDGFENRRHLPRS